MLSGAEIRERFLQYYEGQVWLAASFPQQQPFAGSG